MDRKQLNPEAAYLALRTALDRAYRAVEAVNAHECLTVDGMRAMGLPPETAESWQTLKAKGERLKEEARASVRELAADLRAHSIILDGGRDHE